MIGAGQVSGAERPAGMAYLPPGTFTMGCDDRDKCDPDESPAHQVTLTKGFYLDQKGFTERQIEELKKAQPNNSDIQSIKTSCDIDEPRGAWNWVRRKLGLSPVQRTETCDKPVNNVTFNDATAVCKALGKRLPTEAEREYAARGLSGVDEYGTSTGKLKDSNGNLLAQYGKYNLIDARSVAGTFAPKLFGDNEKIYDLAGNLWEWVSDWYGSYPTGPVTDPKGPDQGTARIVRGGSWFSSGGSAPHDLRAADRFDGAPGDPVSGIGFRCAQDSK